MHDEAGQSQETASYSGGVQTRGAPDTAREPYVHGAMGELEDAVEQLAHVTQTLLGRLGPVLTPESPTSDMAKIAEAERAPVPLADRIDHQSLRVRSVTGLLDDVLGRLEV